MDLLASPSPTHHDPKPLHHDSKPLWLAALAYVTTFDQAKDQIIDLVDGFFSNTKDNSKRLNAVEACVSIKNANRATVFENDSHRYFFSDNEAVTRRIPENDTSWSANNLSEQTDALIQGGVQSMDYEHAVCGHDGRSYLFRTRKMRVDSNDDAADSEFVILTVSRPITVLGDSEHERSRNLVELFRRFQGMDRIDQTICRLDAQGETTKSIAVAVGLTSRSVENRRRKMLDTFEVNRTIDLLRITIRLEEHGFLVPYHRAGI